VAAEHVTVARVQGELEAQQVVSFLAAHGIEAILRGEALRVTHGLTLDGIGLVEVQVGPEDLVEANQLLMQVHRGELRLSDDEPD
jgi:predicted deacylase